MRLAGWGRGTRDLCCLDFTLRRGAEVTRGKGEVTGGKFQLMGGGCSGPEEIIDIEREELVAVIAGGWLGFGIRLLHVMMVVIAVVVIVLGLTVVLGDEKGLRVLAKSEHGSLQADEKTHDCEQN